MRRTLFWLTRTQEKTSSAPGSAGPGGLGAGARAGPGRGEAGRGAALRADPAAARSRRLRSEPLKQTRWRPRCRGSSGRPNARFKSAGCLRSKWDRAPARPAAGGAPPRADRAGAVSVSAGPPASRRPAGADPAPRWRFSGAKGSCRAWALGKCAQGGRARTLLCGRVYLAPLSFSHSFYGPS